MPFPPGYHATPRGAPLAKAVADARWVVDNAEQTVHATHTAIVDGLANGLPYSVLNDAADAAIEAREALMEGAEIIDQVSADTYDPDVDGHAGAVSDRDRADLERGRERAWTAHLAGSAIIDRLGRPRSDTATSALAEPADVGALREPAQVAGHLRPVGVTGARRQRLAAQPPAVASEHLGHLDPRWRLGMLLRTCRHLASSC